VLRLPEVHGYGHASMQEASKAYGPFQTLYVDTKEVDAYIVVAKHND
jgi:hypothetical protein